jgi:ubiquinone/menaquinone biosynthesis C-methylase UbiE
MIARLRERAAREGVADIDARVADGCALPFPDASFDAGFSSFGLMFFPDRARGFGELLRVLRPGAQAVVSSWAPMTRVPVLSISSRRSARSSRRCRSEVRARRGRARRTSPPRCAPPASATSP